MNTNRVCPTDSHCTKPLKIRLAPIPVDKRVTYVYSVCAALTDSRFGPGRTTPIMIDLSESPEIETELIYDMTDEGPVPSYSILPDSEIAHRYVADIIRCELGRAALRAGKSTRISGSPSTLGRGSPPRSQGRNPTVRRKNDAGGVECL